MKVRLLISILCIGCFKLFSQSNTGDTLLIEPYSVKVSDFEPYQTVWSQDVVDPDGKKRKGINTITDSVSIDSKNGNQTIHRVLRWEDKEGNFYEKFDRLEFETFKPRSVDVRWNPSSIEHVDIEGNTVIGTKLKNQFSKSRIAITDLEEIGYTWSSDGFALIAAKNTPRSIFSMKILTGLPLKPKNTLKTFEYLRDEKIEIIGIGNFNTKVIEDLSSGNTKTTYWLSEEKPYVVKVRFIQPTGQITTWKLESID